MEDVLDYMQGTVELKRADITKMAKEFRGLLDR